MSTVDVSDPASPVVVSSISTPDKALDVAVSNGLAFVAADTMGLRIIDVSDPAAPIEIGFARTAREAYGVSVEGDRVVVSGVGGIEIYDVSACSNTEELPAPRRPRRRLSP
jgi:hypothetical protein